jgi:hypothetical protein
MLDVKGPPALLVERYVFGRAGTEGRSFMGEIAHRQQRMVLTAADIASRTRNAAELFARNERLGLVVVDHLGKVRASRRYQGQKSA